MPTVNAAAYFEYSITTTATIQTGIFTGSSLGQIIENVKAVANFKHIDTYQVITYNGAAIVNPQAIINPERLK